MSLYNEPGTQFSVYSIDCARVTEIRPISDKTTDHAFHNRVMEFIIYSVQKKLQQRNARIIKIDSGAFIGLLFITQHQPAWKNVLMQVLLENSENSLGQREISRILLNVNASYILLYQDDDYIYAMTGGYGSQYIKSYIDRNFGLNLLPKVLNEDYPALRQVLQNHLSGNQVSTNSAHRYATNFHRERNLNSIFRQFSVEIDNSIAREFGIPHGAGTYINLENKDSFVIKKSLTLQQLIIVLQKFSVLSRQEDKFALNYLVEAKKKNLKSQELLERLESQFAEERVGDFFLVGQEYSQYLTDSVKFIIYNKENDVFTEEDHPIKLADLFSRIKDSGKRISKYFIHDFLKKWKISTQNESGAPVLDAIPIIDAIQGHIIAENSTPVYLFNGVWYVLDKRYEQVLKTEFAHIIEKHMQKAALITSNFPIVHFNKKRKGMFNEQDYSEVLESEGRVIVTHTVQMHFVEMADAVFWDEHTIYLLHSKKRFNGSGCRDVLNQILTSAEYLQKIRQSFDREWLALAYYQLIVHKRPQIGATIKRDEFIDALLKKEVCYIAGYLYGYGRETKSNYAKFLTVDAERRLSELNYGFFSMSVTGHMNAGPNISSLPQRILL